MRRTWLVAAALLAGCAGAAPERVREGERLLASGDADGALKIFVEVLRKEKEDTTPQEKRRASLDLRRAQVGEAKAYLAKGDLVGAQARLLHLDDSISDKWFLLGDIAVRERKPVEAEKYLRAAQDHAHGPEAAALLASVIAGEARDPERFIEAATVLERAGDAVRAGALREAAAVWRDGSGEPRARLEKVQALAERLGPLPAARVLLARLLERAGQADAAAKAWDLTGLTPAPSADFLRDAAELRARLALERGDASALDRALEQADPATATAVRSRIARARAARGDLAGALALWRRVGETAGARSPAWAEAAWLEEALGLPTAPEAWAKAEAAVDGSPAASALTLERARVAAHRAALGDVAGATALLTVLPDPPPGAAPLPAGVQDGVDRAARSFAVLARGLDALLAGDAARAAALARALRVLDPGGPTGKALAAAAAQLQGSALVGAPAATQRLLDEVRLRLALAGGDLATAASLLAGGVDGARAQGAIEGALLAALAAGRLADVTRFLEAQGGALAPTTRWRLRASAAARALPDTLLAAPRGPAALQDGRAFGAVAWSATGQRVALVELVVHAAERTLTGPDGARADGAGPALDAGARLYLDPAVDADAWSRLGPPARAEVDPPTDIQVLR